MDDIFSSLLSMRVDPEGPCHAGMTKTPLTPPLPADLTPEMELVRRHGGIPSCSTCYDKRFDADKVDVNISLHFTILNVHDQNPM